MAYTNCLYHGLSIGVHLLNLVTIPALALIYYFKKNEHVTRWGIITTLAVGGSLILLIMYAIIPVCPVWRVALKYFCQHTRAAF